jgi:16S rRNA (cytosine1402-N4)-methyltransferase
MTADAAGPQMPPSGRPSGRPARHHVPVLLAEMLDAVAPADGNLIVDATFGRGGYTRAFLEAANCTVVGADRDPEAIAFGRSLAAEYPSRLQLVEGNFADLDRLVSVALDRPAEGAADGVVFDLGVSSPQLDDPARGFSFRTDGPLDMRMGRTGPTAAEVVNRLPADELADIIYRYGEERLSRRIARAIVSARQTRPITRTLELADIVRRVVPRARDGIDPATRTFQALRLYVNDELDAIERGLEAAERVLGPGGRLAVIAFHSLEDRKVKQFLDERSGAAESVSRHLPAPVGARPAPTFRISRRKPITPGATELAANPRARSARLRAALRTDAAARNHGLRTHSPRIHSQGEQS